MDLNKLMQTGLKMGPAGAIKVLIRDIKREEPGGTMIIVKDKNKINKHDIDI